MRRPRVDRGLFICARTRSARFNHFLTGKAAAAADFSRLRNWKRARGDIAAMSEHISSVTKALLTLSVFFVCATLGAAPGPVHRLAGGDPVGRGRLCLRAAGRGLLRPPPRQARHRPRNGASAQEPSGIRNRAARDPRAPGRTGRPDRTARQRPGKEDRRRTEGAGNPDARFRRQDFQRRRAGAARGAARPARPGRAYVGTFGDKDELLETIRSSLEENRVDLYLQPIVSLPQRKLRYYEALSRLRDENGQVIMPAQYMQVAGQAGLMSVVDNLLLFRCVQIVRRLTQKSRDIGIFCNISGDTLADKRILPPVPGLYAGQPRSGRPDHFRIQPGRGAARPASRANRISPRWPPWALPSPWTMSKPWRWISCA